MEKKLQRNEQDKMLAGVCSGLADYFDVDVTWIRIAFVVATLAGFSGVLAYIILWIAVPARPFIPGAPYPGSSRYTADYRVHPEPAAYTATTQTVTGEPVLTPRKSGNGRMIAGLVLVAFGAYFLLDEFNVIPYWFDFDKLWPLVFIIPGLLIISKNGKRRHYHEEEKIHTETTTAPGENLTTTETTGTTTTTTSETVIKQDETKL